MTSTENDANVTTADAVNDEEHRILECLLEKVRVISAAPDRNVEIMHALTDMYLYAKKHFFDEEALMERQGYPERERHAALHREFLERTHALVDASLAGKLDFAELSRFLSNWFTQHATEEDGKITLFAQRRARGEA